MNELANNIYEIIKDYRNHDGIYITPDYIIEWANQFGGDALLVLTELNKILPETYISRDKAKQNILSHLESYLKLYSYTNITTFLIETQFIDCQLPHKSQPAILNLLEEVLMENYQESYKKYIDYPKKNYIYFDDVLASGSTIGKHCVEFLITKDDKEISFAQKLENNEINLSISVFCMHIWGFEFQKFRISKTPTLSEKISKKINWFWNYEVQNHAKFNNQSLNVARPIKLANSKINGYLENLDATKYEDYAYRKINTPVKEVFFTTPENRINFENILIEKGIDIINMIQGDVKPNIRPLGLINPNYKIFGLGTHFFTWRNIPNNSPLVYWWEVSGHNWKPLFSVANRG
ncbi:phosphoribosyltransferase-like protein [Empedobacter falsenii]|uniref:phosphoribosyltransferase-like protein n=1 Tax=Empedobacter sp. GD03797 TaxID=2975382 RepID=UPI00244C3BD8|nr:hypothetical protein [Empedobacter sp. GD03797]MDH1883700.1 hypothetical protein [Empedobacter sp. GD03797]